MYLFVFVCVHKYAHTHTCKQPILNIGINNKANQKGKVLFQQIILEHLHMCVHKQKDLPPPYTQKYLRHFTDLTVKPGIESFLTKEKEKC